MSTTFENLTGYVSDSELEELAASDVSGGTGILCVTAIATAVVGGATLLGITSACTKSC